MQSNDPPGLVQLSTSIITEPPCWRWRHWLRREAHNHSMLCHIFECWCRLYKIIQLKDSSETKSDYEIACFLIKSWKICLRGFSFDRGITKCYHYTENTFRRFSILLQEVRNWNTLYNLEALLEIQDFPKLCYEIKYIALLTPFLCDGNPTHNTKFSYFEDFHFIFRKPLNLHQTMTAFNEVIGWWIMSCFLNIERQCSYQMSKMWQSKYNMWKRHY